jgi:hypothetical protein
MRDHFLPPDPGPPENPSAPAWTPRDLALREEIRQLRLKSADIIRRSQRLMNGDDFARGIENLRIAGNGDAAQG